MSAGHAAHIQAHKTPLISFSAATHQKETKAGAANFCALTLKTFGHSFSYALHAFHAHPLKICPRGMDKISEV